MKKIFKSVLTLGLVAGLGFAANAQTTSVINTNVNASAEILSALSLTKDTDIDFGTLSASTPGAVFLDPQGALNTNTGVTTSVGKFTLAGSVGASVKVSWPATLELQGDGAPADKIIYQLLVFGKDEDDASTSASLGVQGVAETVDVVLNTTIAPSPLGGKFYLYVGGGFPALSSQATGSYTAVANFTVEYN